MMRLFCKLLTSSKASKQPLLMLERSFPAFLVSKKHSNKPRFFSSQPNVITQEGKFSQTYTGIEGVEEKGTSGIHIISTQHVKPDKPTPHKLRSYKLSALDQTQIPTYMPLIFFYANKTNGNNNMNIGNLVVERSKLLRDSLSETLTRFYPFAGKYVSNNNIDCNDEGVLYVETRVDGDLSSFLAKPDYKLLQGLVPVPSNLKEPTQGYYLSMIQVNFFSCGGVAISMSNSHKLIDGSTCITFLNAWASAAKGDQQNMINPNFIASSLFLPNTKQATNTTFPLSFLAVCPLTLMRGKRSTKRFRFDASALQALKAKATASVSSTRVVAVTSLIWQCATTASRKLHGERPSILRTAVNIRGRFAPPLPRNAIGNIIWSVVARCESNDSLRLDTMAGKLKDAIAKVDTSFVEKFLGEQGCDNVIDEMMWLAGHMSSYDADYYSSSSICNFGINDADFGWGRPVWSCFAYFGNDSPLYANIMILMDTSNGNGIEAWVTLGQEVMDLLERDPDLLLYASVEPSPLQG